MTTLAPVPAAKIAPAAPPSNPPPEASGLLPPLFTGPSSFLWFWALPVCVLLALNLHAYHLIEGILDPAGQRAAALLGAILLGGLLLSLGLFFRARRRERRLGTGATRQAWWALPALGVHVAYLWAAVECSSSLLSRNGANAWIYPETRYFLHQFTFAMVPLFHALLRLACAGAPVAGGRAIAKNLAAAVGAPLLVYLGAQLVFALRQAHRVDGVVVATLVVAGGVVMFACLVRAMLLVLRAAARGGGTAERIAIVVAALVLPLGGLALNTSIPFPVDLQAKEVYLLTVLNGVLLLAGSFLLPRRPLVALPILALTFPFALYFFTLFLPYLPLAILAVIAFGAGFLILAPTLLFALHLHLLWRAARLASASGLRPVRIAALIAAGVAFIPAAFVARALADRSALNAALDYAYTPAISNRAPAFSGDRRHVVHALAAQRDYKEGRYYPIISEAYAGLVFDGLVLPDAKLEHLEMLFAGKVGGAASRKSAGFFQSNARRHSMPRATPPPRRVEVSALDLVVRPLTEATSSTTLALTLSNPDPAGAEYIRRLPLPPGVLVRGFRLHVGGVPMPGRIVEKKTALWVYTMIRDTERRDPGLLFFNRPDELELRVYPVAHDTPSRVEIDFLVPASAASLPSSPGDFARDPGAALAALAPPDARLVRPASDAVLATGLETARLPAARRPAYLHLLVDRTEANAFHGDLATAIQSLRLRFPSAESARISLVNLDVVPLVPELVPLDTVARIPAPEIDDALPPGGGLNLDAALAHAIRHHQRADLDAPRDGRRLPPRPVFIVLGARARLPAVPDLPLARAWADLLPGLELHALGADGSFDTCSPAPADTPLLRLGAALRPLVTGRIPRFPSATTNAPLEYWDALSAAWRPVAGISDHAEPADAPWPAGLALQLRQQDRARAPGDASADGLADLLAEARRTGILTADASYIVVENSAQWRALEAAEARKLGQHEALDHLEAPAPGAWLVFAAFITLRHLPRRNRVPTPSLATA